MNIIEKKLIRKEKYPEEEGEEEIYSLYHYYIKLDYLDIEGQAILFEIKTKNDILDAVLELYHWKKLLKRILLTAEQEKRLIGQLLN